MRKITQLVLFSIFAVIMGATSVSADSFGFYFGSDGFGVNLNIGDYDYYDRHSPGFYDSSNLDFHAALNPYGRWVYDIQLGGDIWVPNVHTGWRPFTQGSWSYTQYGWTWVAYEPWGWIPHHYGNWVNHYLYGWTWIPGYTWSPAQVTWGSFNGYYGWAPLPPRHCSGYYRRYASRHTHHHHHWYNHTNYYSNPFMVRQQNGYDYYNDNDAYYRSIPNEAWVMVDHRDFTSGNIADVAINANRVPTVLSKSRFEILSQAPEKQMIERFTGKRVNRVRVDETVKTVNGNKIKLVRPVDVLETQRNHVSKVHKQFKVQTTNVQNSPVNKPRSNQQQVNRPTINKPTTPNTINNQRPVDRPSNHNTINRPNNNQLTKPNRHNNKVNRPATNNHQLNRPANKPGKINHPAPKPQIRKPAPQNQLRQPAPNTNIKQPKPQKPIEKKKFGKKAKNNKKEDSLNKEEDKEKKNKGLKRLKR